MVDWTKRRGDVLLAVGVVVLVAVFLFLQIIRAGEPLGLDQGLFACFGRWVPRGSLPYRDIFDTKPPAFLYTWVLAWAFGNSAASVWWFEAVWLAGAMLLMFQLAARLWGRWAGLAAAACLFFGLWSPGFGGYWSRAQAEELLTVPTLGAALTALLALERPRMAIWTGVLMGLVGLYKIPGMALAGVWPVLWIAQRPLPDAARRVGWMVTGLALPWAVAVGWFAAHGALREFFEAVIVFQRHYAAYIAPPWGYVLQEFPRILVSAVPSMVLAATAGLVALWRSDRSRAAWLTSWVVLTCGAVILQRQLGGYHYLLVIPALALAGAHGLVALANTVRRGGPAARAFAVVTLAAVAVLAAHQSNAWRREYGTGAALRFGRLTREDYLSRFERGLLSPAVEEEAARYLRAHTQAQDGILVWGLSPGIYALADRHPVTRFPFHKLLLTNAPLSNIMPGLADRRAAFMRQLNQDPPVYILVGTRDRNPFEPEDSAAGMLHFGELASYVHDNYRPETRIGRFVVLRRQP